MPSLCWGSFWGILGPIFAYVHIFSRYLFNILSWNFAQVFLVWPWLSLILFFWHHVPIFRGSFKSIFEPILGCYVYFLRTVKYVLWNFVQTFLVFLLRVTELFFSMSWPFWEALGGIFGLILGIVYLIIHNCSIFSHQTYTTGVLSITMMVTTLKNVFVSCSPALIFAYLSLFLENCSILFK